MLGIKKIVSVSNDGYIKLKIPKEMGNLLEVICFPANYSEDGDYPDCMIAQERTAFFQEVLADKAEDVWNNL
ncbi:MAG: hypothetical protein HQM08_10085 [Candidatus Riflebacteria bacterium]|nr:hypothetical protein [Candidatus Riflebacteria bacterium]